MLRIVWSCWFARAKKERKGLNNFDERDSIELMIYGWRSFHRSNELSTVGGWVEGDDFTRFFIVLYRVKTSDVHDEASSRYNYGPFQVHASDRAKVVRQHNATKLGQSTVFAQLWQRTNLYVSVQVNFRIRLLNKHKLEPDGLFLDKTV